MEQIPYRFAEQVSKSILWARSNKKNRAIAIGLLVFIVIAIETFSWLAPTPKIHSCGPSIEFLRFFHVQMLCDSYWYMMDAQNPRRLLFGGTSIDAENTLLQDRPGISITALLISKLIIIIPGFNKKISYGGVDGSTVNYNLNTFAAYIFINLIVLMIGLYLIVKIFQNNYNSHFVNYKSTILYVSGFLIIMSMNQITKIFFWIPNSGIFNTFIPVYMVWLIKRKDDFTKPKFQVSQSIFTAIGTLMYPMFLVCIPLIIILSFGKRRILGLVTSAIAFLPYLVWPVIIKVLGGNTLYHGAKNYDQFTWIIKSAKEGILVKSVLDNFTLYMSSFSVTPLVGIFCCFAILIRNNGKSGYLNFLMAMIARRKYEFFAIAFYFLWLFLIGMYDTRWSWGPTFLLLLVAGEAMHKRNFKISNSVITIWVGIVILNLVSWVGTPMPWS